MKLRETEFFREFTSIVAGCVLLVASVAFASIPAALGHNPGDRPAAVARAEVFHLT